MKKLIFSLLFVVLFVLSLPTLLSTKIGVGSILSPVLRYTVHESMEVEAVQLSWFNQQEVYGLRWTEDNASIALEELKTDANLFHLIPSKILIHGKSRYREQTGKINIELEEDDIRAELTDFPLRLLHHFVKGRIQPADLLGESLNLSVTPEGSGYRLLAKSENLIADTRFDLNKERISISETGKFQLTVKKELMNTRDLRMIEDAHVDFTIEDIEIKNGLSTRLDIYAFCPLVQFENDLSMEKADLHYSLIRTESAFALEARCSHGPSGKTGRIEVEGGVQSGILTAEGRIDRLPAQWAAEWLPQELSSEADLHFKVNDHRLTIDCSSETIAFNDVQVLVGDRLELYKPATIRIAGENHLTVANLTELRTDTLSLTPERTYMKGALSIPQAVFTAGKIENGLIKFSGTPSEGLEVEYTAYFIPLEDYQIIDEWKGSGQGSIVFDREWNPFIKRLNIHGKRHQSEVRLTVHQDEKNNFRGSGNVVTTLLPEQLFHDALPHQLNAPLELKFQIRDLLVDGRSFKPVKANLQIGVDQLHFGEKLAPPLFTLTDLTGFATYEKEQLKGNLKAHVREGIAEGEVEVALSNLLNPMQGKGVVKGKNFPVGVLEHFFSVPSLKTIFGPHINGTLVIEEDRHADLDLHNDRVHAKGSFMIDHKITLNSPLTVDWLISPENLQNLKSGYTSMHPSYLHLKMDRMTLNQAWDLEECEFDLVLKGLKVVKERNLSTLHLDRLESRVNYQPGKRIMELALNLSGKVQGKETTPFHVDFNGKKQGDDITLKGEGRDFPVKRLAKIGGAPKEWLKNLHAFAGSRVSGSVEAEINGWSGPFSLKIETDRSYLVSEGAFDKRILRLRSPLLAELQVSEDLRGSFLTEPFFFLDYVISGDRPLKLVVNPDGAEWDTRKPLKDSMKINDFSIDFGRLYFQNQGPMTEILTMFNLFPAFGEFTVWFTPQYMTLDSGKLYLKRMDALLAEHYPVASWGSINLIKQEMSMKIGIPPTTLRRAFKLNGVPKDYMLQITLKGSTEDPKVRHGASARYKAFFSQFRSGIQGILIDSLIKVIANENKPPKPMTKPFPWTEKQSRV